MKKEVKRLCTRCAGELQRAEIGCSRPHTAKTGAVLVTVPVRVRSGPDVAHEGTHLRGVQRLRLIKDALLLLAAQSVKAGLGRLVALQLRPEFGWGICHSYHLADSLPQAQENKLRKRGPYEKSNSRNK